MPSKQANKDSIGSIEEQGEMEDTIVLKQNPIVAGNPQTLNCCRTTTTMRDCPEEGEMRLSITVVQYYTIMLPATFF
jgi:hypothetical protein